MVSRARTSWCVASVAMAALLASGAAALAPDGGPADAETRRQAFAAYREGQEALAGERWEQAEAAFRRAIQLEPLLTLAHYGLGQSYMGLRRFSSAARAYTACLDAARAIHQLRFTDRTAADRQIGEEIRELRESIRRIQGGQVKTGGPQMVMRLEHRIAELERMKSSASGPFRPPAEVLLALGSAHFRGGDVGAAEEHWRAAVEGNPSLGEAHNNLAVVYMMSGRLAEAEAAVTLAKRHGFRVNPALEADIRKARGGEP